MVKFHSKQRLLFYFILLTLSIVSCNKDYKNNADRFKQGVFEIPAAENYSKTTITRIDSLQIEEYTKNISVSSDSGLFNKQTKHIDTLIIKWKNNFAYTLWMKNPKTDLEKDPIFVQVTKVKDSSYNFKARIGYSKFATPGTIYIKK